MLRAFCRCSRASNDTGAPCNPVRGRAAGWRTRSEEDTCSMLRAFSRSRGRNVPASASRCPIPRQCPHYDCNRPPWRIWSDEEKRWLRDLAARHGADECTLVDTESFCRPVIDVLPDLRAVRCFGMSAFEKVDIRDYANVNDLAAHFMRRIDRPAYRIKAMPECENCHLRRTWLCCQGCMGYKMVEIGKMNAERGE